MNNLSFYLNTFLTRNFIYLFLFLSRLFVLLAFIIGFFLSMTLCNLRMSTYILRGDTQARLSLSFRHNFTTVFSSEIFGMKSKRTFTKQYQFRRKILEMKQNIFEENLQQSKNDNKQCLINIGGELICHRKSIMHIARYYQWLV